MKYTNLFGETVKVRRSREPEPVSVPASRRSRFRNPVGGGEPCPDESRQGGEPFSVTSRQGEYETVDQLLALTTNRMCADVALEREFVMGE